MREHEPSPETSEWLTPKYIFDALGLVFDLDPAHPGRDTPYCCVPTREIYTKADDGLLRPWHGLVWLNPPYSDKRRAVVPWLKKFFAHGNGIFLLPARTSADYWHKDIFPNAELLLFTDGKIKFVRRDGSRGEQPGFGNALIGAGAACATLLSSGLGACVVVDRSAAASARAA